MPMSGYLEAKILNEVFGATNYTAPVNLYWGLSTAATSGATDAAILAGEPSSTGGYARVAVTNNTTNFPAQSAGGGSGVTMIWVAGPGPTGIASFPVSTGSGWSSSGSLLPTWFLADALTLAGGNVIWLGASGLLSPVNSSGITIFVNTTGISFTLV